MIPNVYNWRLSSYATPECYMLHCVRYDIIIEDILLLCFYPLHKSTEG